MTDCFYIQEVRKFYGGKSTTHLVQGYCEILCFDSKEDAKEWIEAAYWEIYHLLHNQYEYEYRVLDYAKPRNAAWVDYQMGADLI